MLTFTCTADASNGSWPAVALSQSHIDRLTGFYLYKLIINPGATPPTDNWDFTITDSDGIDILGGSGSNMHTTNSAMIAPKLNSSTYFAQPIYGALNLNISGNIVHSAVIVIKAIFVK
jgi:hypothetical protein